jgi:hypothetical protein
MENKKGSIGTVFLVLTILIISIGWIMNVVKFCKCDFEDPYKTEIIRGVGIPVFPMGAVCGFMDIGEELKNGTE